MIKLEAIGGFHILRVEDILHISPRDDNRCKNKSEITLRSGSNILYSTETQEDIFNKMNQYETR